MSVAQQNNRDNRRIESRAGERTGSPTIDRIHEETKMNEPKEVFLLLLSNARHGQRAGRFTARSANNHKYRR
jgi:hypothetical protein